MFFDGQAPTTNLPNLSSQGTIPISSLRVISLLQFMLGRLHAIRLPRTFSIHTSFCETLFLCLANRYDLGKFAKRFIFSKVFTQAYAKIVDKHYGSQKPKRFFTYSLQFSSHKIANIKFP